MAATINVQVWTHRFLGTESRARELARCLRELDGGLWCPDRWGQFEPADNVFDQDAEDALARAFVEDHPRGSGRNTNLLVFQKKRPRALVDVHCWRAKVPDLNSLHAEFDHCSFADTNGPERVVDVLLSFTAWADGIFASAAHSQQRHRRGVGGTPLQRLKHLSWLTYFGAPYAQLVGLEHLLRTPSHATRQVRDGVLLMTAPRPDSPEMIDSTDTLLRMEEHIGPRLFAGAGYPNEPCLVPSFDLSETVITAPLQPSQRVH